MLLGGDHVLCGGDIQRVNKDDDDDNENLSNSSVGENLLNF